MIGNARKLEHGFRLGFPILCLKEGLGDNDVPSFWLLLYYRKLSADARIP